MYAHIPSLLNRRIGIRRLNLGGYMFKRNLLIMGMLALFLLPAESALAGHHDRSNFFISFGVGQPNHNYYQYRNPFYNSYPYGYSYGAPVIMERRYYNTEPYYSNYNKYYNEYYNNNHRRHFRW